MRTINLPVATGAVLPVRLVRKTMRRAGIAALSAATLLVVSAGAAFAAPPTREIIDIGTPEIEALISANLSSVCRFDISVDADATIAVMVFSNNDGTFRREIDVGQIKWTLTNDATGASIHTHNVGPDIFWVNRDGVPMHAIIGRSYVAHEGSGFIGRVLLNADTGEVLAFAGRLTGDIQQLVCNPLAS
jgi:hypothetical protein